MQQRLLCISQIYSPIFRSNRAVVKTVAMQGNAPPVPLQVVTKLPPMEYNQIGRSNLALLVLKEIYDPELPPFPLPLAGLVKTRATLEVTC